jgi:hypothetical protein
MKAIERMWKNRVKNVASKGAQRDCVSERHTIDTRGVNFVVFIGHEVV